MATRTLVAALAVVSLLACSDSFVDTSGPTGDPNPVAARTLSPLPDVPADLTNSVADSAAAATFGQMLFFDKSFSGPIAVDATVANGALGAKGESGKVSCASCHIGAGLDDRRSKPGNVSLGTDYGTRRALPLVNASFYAWTNWGGRFDSQWSLPLGVAENPKIMNGTRLQIVHAIYAKYRAEYEAVFSGAGQRLDARLDPAHPNAGELPSSGKPKANAAAPDGAWELMAEADRTIVNRIYSNYGKAIAAYLRKLVSRHAPFDRYAAGDKTAISPAADRGLGVFSGKGQCVACHNGPHFEDGEFHALGIPSSDLGRYADVPPLLDGGNVFDTSGPFSDNVDTGKLTGLAQTESQRGQFRTKSLRNIAVAGPYMHAGQLSTLEDVVAFYNKGGGDAAAAGVGVVKDRKLHVLELTPEESADLVEFLKTLTGAPVPDALDVDTSKP